jgi:hypothetical protein
LLLLDLWLIRLNVLLRQRRQWLVHAVPGQIEAMLMLPFSWSKQEMSARTSLARVNRLPAAMLAFWHN